MITGALKSKVDSIWDTMWSGGISNPLSVIEQLTYLLFIKRLDELHTLKEAKAASTGKPIEDPVFTAKQDKLRWSRFKEAAPEQMFETVRDVFLFIKTLGQKGEADGDGGSTYSHHMRDALFMMPTARVLANVVDQLDGIDMADSDTKGDLYEYMLGKIATAGQNGQFRTPRHIIRLMVNMTASTPKDVICDPACGSQERGAGVYWEFRQKLEGAEAGFRKVHLGKIRDGALNIGVEKRTVVRRKAIINEAGETVPAPDSELYTEQTTTERPPDAKLSQWLLERKWPERYSRKHIEVSATVKSEDLLIRLTHHATRCSVSWWRFAGRVKTAIPENTLGISVPVRN